MSPPMKIPRLAITCARPRGGSSGRRRAPATAARHPLDARLVARSPGEDRTRGPRSARAARATSAKLLLAPRFLRAAGARVVEGEGAWLRGEEGGGLGALTREEVRRIGSAALDGNPDGGKQREVAVHDVAGVAGGVDATAQRIAEAPSRRSERGEADDRRAGGAREERGLPEPLRRRSCGRARSRATRGAGSRSLARVRAATGSRRQPACRRRRGDRRSGCLRADPGSGSRRASRPRHRRAARSPRAAACG